MESAERRTRLNGRKVRSVYLITYSKANVEIISSRESFAVVVLDSFQNADATSKTKVLQWVCSQERHQNGEIHYHMAVKLDRNRRWLTVRNYADKKHGLKLNFSSSHANYFSAWKYATKDDEEYLESECHPDLKNAPQTQEASKARIAGMEEMKNAGKRENEDGSSGSRFMKFLKWQCKKELRVGWNCCPLLISRRKKAKLIWPSLSPIAATKQ